MEFWAKRQLTGVQIGVVSETRERDLLIAGYVKPKFAQAEIDAGLRPSIQHAPTIPVLDLMVDLRGCHADLQRTEAFFLASVGNFDLVRFRSIANDRPLSSIWKRM